MKAILHRNNIARLLGVRALMLAGALLAAILIFQQVSGGGRLALDAGSSKLRESAQSLGNLVPASGDESSRVRVIQTLIKAVQSNESEQRQGDVYLVQTTSNSPLFWESVTETAASLSREGRTVEHLNREETLGPTTRRVRWAFSDGRSRYEWLIEKRDADQSGMAHQVEAAYDGAYSYIHYPERREASVQLGPNSMATQVEAAWLTLREYNGKPLSALLETPGTTYDGRQSIGDTECVKLTAPHGTSELELWLSPNHRYAAKRISNSWTVAGGYGNRTVVEVERFAQHGDTWFPEKGRYISYRLSDTGQMDWMTTTDWSVISYKGEAPDALFQVHFPLGTRVSDMVHARSYTVGAPETTDKAMPLSVTPPPPPN